MKENFRVTLLLKKKQTNKQKQTKKPKQARIRNVQYAAGKSHPPIAVTTQGSHGSNLEHIYIRMREENMPHIVWVICSGSQG